MPLYCENHRAAIYDRGGRNIMGQLENITKVQWERTRDDVSIGSVTVAQPSKGCLDLLKSISANRHELVIWRGNERVWEGPITHIGRHADVFDISARDIMHYVYRTAAHQEWDSSSRWVPDEKDPNRVFQDNTEPVVDRAYNMLAAELGRAKENPSLVDPVINVVPYITKVRATDISQERNANRRTLAYGISVYDDMEAMATYGGMDYTVVGRRLILNDNRVVLGRTPVLTEADFISEVVVTSYGMDSFTRAITTGDEGMYGVAGGVDPFYGEWENIEQMFDEDSLEAPTQNALDNAASYNMYNRLPVPTIVRVPNNSRLNPNGTLSMRDLVPGVIVPVRASLVSIELIQDQKLNNVSVSETGKEGEVINVTLGAPSASYLE